ncbi:hypothetical protein VTL71DRAFT_5506 [Oculimacula yallundae]|uniref:RNase III domain-containing protein n=1 Tax=Oculimacula yallundae TaxID=86028 RepID=A0ABR4C1A0_9HELO
MNSKSGLKNADKLISLEFSYVYAPYYNLLLLFLFLFLFLWEKQHLTSPSSSFDFTTTLLLPVLPFLLLLLSGLHTLTKHSQSPIFPIMKDDAKRSPSLPATLTTNERELQSKLGHTFANPTLLLEALQVKGNGVRKFGSKTLEDGNKRLALLGDAVLTVELLRGWYKEDGSRIESGHDNRASISSNQKNSPREATQVVLLNSSTSRSTTLVALYQRAQWLTRSRH